MRITTNMMRSQYIKNIRRVTNDMARANEIASTGRKFLKGSEDTVSTINIYRLREDQRKTEIYERAINDVDGFLTTAESGLMSISDSLTNVGALVLQASNGTMSNDERKVIAAELEHAQQSILNTLNADYSGKHVFGGGGRNERPYTLDAGGELLYRGVNVNDNANLADLDMMANEKIGINILSGDITNPDGTQTNVFDSTVSGLNFMGYGTDGEGNPNNIYTLLGNMKDELQKDPFDIAELNKNFGKFQDQTENISVEIANIGGKTNYLEAIKSRNLDIKHDTQDKLAELEYVDYAEALVDFQIKEYSYTASISMGSKILQNSIIDFLR